MGGDGQVITSVDDLLKWDAMFYEPGPGGQALLDRLHTRGVLNSGDTIDYALGLIVGEYRGAPRIRHGGGGAGFRAQLVRFPEQHTSVAFLCNRSDVSPLMNDVVDVVLADHLDPPEPSVADPQAGTDSELFPREPVELTDAQLRRWEGIYTDADGGFVVSFRVRGGRLFITSPAGPSPMQPYSENHFEIVARGGRVIFAGEGASRTVHQLGTTIALGVIEEYAPTPDELAQLAGTYHSPQVLMLSGVGPVP